MVSGDEVSQSLQQEVGGLFAMLRLLGTIEYENAFMLAGYVQDGSLPQSNKSGDGTFQYYSGVFALAN